MLHLDINVRIQRIINNWLVYALFRKVVPRNSDYIKCSGTIIESLI